MAGATVALCQYLPLLKAEARENVSGEKKIVLECAEAKDYGESNNRSQNEQ